MKNSVCPFMLTCATRSCSPSARRNVTSRRGLVTGNTTGGPAAVIGLGVQPKHGPATDNDLSSVVEIIA